jgi:hypothetical protein
MRKTAWVLGIIACAFSTTAMASDLALYVGPPNDGWYTAANVAKDAETIIAKTGHLFKDVQKFDDKQFTDFIKWIEANTDDGEMDIIWLNGTIPSCLYQFPNVNPNGSRAELWLDGGNMIINVGDWFAYCSYEGGARQADNGGSGAANILDLAAGIIVSADNTSLQVTAAGQQYLPSITNPIDSDRPVGLGAVVAPWEVAAVFGQNAAGTQADPAVIHNTVTGAYVAFINQANPGFADRGLVCSEFILNWVNTVIGLTSPSLAADPVPEDGAADVLQDTVLSWLPGDFAATHDVYFGTSFADVNTASRTSPKGVLVSQDQTATEYDPDGLLAFGQTYFWRVDEVNAAPDTTIFKGQVWSFTAETYAYPITAPITATSSGNSRPDTLPQNTVNGSGLNADDQHSVELTQMWMSNEKKPQWIQYEFDKVYKLDELRVWNANQVVEAFIGFGARNVAIEYSIDGTTWTTLEGVPEFARAPGSPTYTANTTVDFGGVMAKFVKLTINSNWGGVAPQVTLSEVRFFSVPVQAFNPQPATGAANVSVETDLNWRPGREATSHKVAVGTDSAAVAAGVGAQTVTDHSYTPANLLLGTQYSWKVDEVGDAGVYAGDVWSFTTEEYTVVDSFDGYKDDMEAENTIWHTWIDGLTDQASGSVVGYDAAPFAERTIVHGGAQSMPLTYDNTSFAFSQTKRTFDGTQDWTARGVKSLSLWFQGVAGNGGQLYVKINDTKVLYDGAAADLARPAWQVWNIDLSKAGNVKSVRSLTIGVEGSGAKGKLYIDDIRLYPKTPVYIVPAAPQATNLAAHYTFDEGSGTRVGDSSGKGNHGTTTGNPQWVAGTLGGALSFDGVDDFVNCGNNASVTNVGSVSVAAWIKLAVGGLDIKVASNQNASTGGYKLGVYSTNMVEFEIRTSANAATLNRAAPGGTAMVPGVWYHVVGVYEKGKALRTYVNGRLDRELLTTVQAGVSTGALMLGREAPAGANWWNGQMDDVRIYSQALSDAEVAGLAGQTLPMHKPF